MAEGGPEEISPHGNSTSLNGFIPHDKANLGARAKGYVLRHGREKGVEILLALDGDGNVVADC